MSADIKQNPTELTEEGAIESHQTIETESQVQGSDAVTVKPLQAISTFEIEKAKLETGSDSPTSKKSRNMPSVVSQLEEAGDEHKYQLKIFIIFAVQWILAAFVIMGQPYLFLAPRFECQDPRDPSRVIECSELEQGCKRKILKPNSQHSVVFEFGLYCENSYLVYTASCITFTMAAVLSLIFAQFAEFRGRKIALLWAYVLGAISMLLASLTTNYWAVVVFYGLAAGGFWAYTTITVVLLAETSSLKYMQFTTTGLLIIWATAEALIPPLSYLFKNWRVFSIIFIAIPAIINFGFFYHVYESPRFLMLKNNFGAVRKIMKKIAKVNGRVFAEDAEPSEEEQEEPLPEKAATETKSKTRTYTYLDLFKYPSVRRMSVGAGLLFFVSNFCYYGTMFALDNLHGSIYWNGFYLALAEYLAYLVSIPLLKRVARKKMILVTLILTVLGSIGLILFSNPQANWYCELYGIDCIDVSMEKVFAVFIKFQVAVCNAVLYVYANELFPTAVKSLGMGYVNCTTMLGSLLASANEAITNWIGVNPMTSFIILCILSIIYFSGMPETKDQPLEDEIEELKKRPEKQADPA